MRKLFSILFLTLVPILIFSQARKSVLFIGNSYTAANNLPLLVSNMAISVGNTLVYSAQTPGGAQLNQHISNTGVINSISSQQWDFVVLQEQSQKPSFNPTYVAANVFPFAKRLCDTIRLFDSCTQPVFFMTWGRKNGDAGNCPSAPWLCTYQGMDSALAKSYNTMGTQNDAFVSPVGAVWNYIRNNDSTINLYSPDESHPSIIGSYAAACTFFTVLYREDPTAISFNSTVNSTVAAYIRNAVKTVVYDSLSKWNIGSFDPKANFTQATFGPVVQYTNTSSLSSTYSWDFGDGNSSTQKNPTHTYSSNGVYTVSLIAEKCGIKDTNSTIISMTTTSIEEDKLNAISIFPNPSASGIITLSNAQRENFKIYSSQNKLITDFSVKSNEEIIDVSYLSTGIYFFISDSGKVHKLIIE